MSSAFIGPHFDKPLLYNRFMNLYLVKIIFSGYQAVVISVKTSATYFSLNNCREHLQWMCFLSLLSLIDQLLWQKNLGWQKIKETSPMKVASTADAKMSDRKLKCLQENVDSLISVSVMHVNLCNCKDLYKIITAIRKH